MAFKRIGDALDAFVRSKQKGTNSGNYQRNARRVVEEGSPGFRIGRSPSRTSLTPHGGRRGAGDVLYREDPVLAQTALRHRSIETTKDSYSYIEAGETASRAGDVFETNRDGE